MDDATLLVLPSWPEGLGRVIIEAFARGRGVVATEAGGIPDLVTHEREGLLIPPADVTALTEALERVLTDRELAARLGAAARERYVDWHSTPEDLAAKLRVLAEATVAGTVALMRLLFVTQTIDADHPALAQTIDLVRALAGRFETVGVLCGSVGRHDLPANVELSTFGASSRAGRGLRFARAARREIAAPPRRRARPHGAALPRPARAAREGETRAAPALVHALARQTLAPCRHAPRRRRAQRRPALVPARDGKAARDRPRHRRRALHARRRRSPGRPPAAALARPDGALEGPRDDARRAAPGCRGGPRRGARAPRARADRRRARASGRARAPGRRCARARVAGADRAARRPRGDPGCAPRRRRSRERDAAARQRDARQGGLRGGGVRRPRRCEQRRAAGVPRRPPGGAELHAGRRGGPRPRPRAASTRPGPAMRRRDRPRAAPPRGRAALARARGPTRSRRSSRRRGRK